MTTDISDAPFMQKMLQGCAITNTNRSERRDTNAQPTGRYLR